MTIHDTLSPVGWSFSFVREQAMVGEPPVTLNESLSQPKCLGEHSQGLGSQHRKFRTDQ